MSKDIGRQIIKVGMPLGINNCICFLYLQTDGIIDCGYFFELQPLGDSNEDPQFIFGQITKLSTYLKSLALREYYRSKLAYKTQSYMFQYNAMNWALT